MSRTRDDANLHARLYPLARLEAARDRLETAQHSVLVADGQYRTIHDHAHEHHSSRSGAEDIRRGFRGEVHASMPCHPDLRGRLEAPGYLRLGKYRPHPPAAFGSCCRTSDRGASGCACVYCAGVYGAGRLTRGRHGP